MHPTSDTAIYEINMKTRLLHFHRYNIFSVRYLPKAFSQEWLPLSDNFPNVQFSKWQVSKGWLGLIWGRRLQWGPSSAARTDKESCLLGNYTVIGSCHLGKYSWEVTTWENTPGKLPRGKKPSDKVLTSYIHVFFITPNTEA